MVRKEGVYELKFPLSQPAGAPGCRAALLCPTQGYKAFQLQQRRRPWKKKKDILCLPHLNTVRESLLKSTSYRFVKCDSTGNFFLNEHFNKWQNHELEEKVACTPTYPHVLCLPALL